MNLYNDFWILLKSKKNRNSVIYKNKNATLFLKRILLDDLDFATRNEKDSDILASKDMIVWKEIKILLLIENFMKQHDLSFLKFYSGNLNVRNKVTCMDLIFEHIPMNMVEYIKIKKNAIIEIILQLFFQCYYLDQLHIHHLDLHAGNVMIRDVPHKKKIRVFFENKYYFIPNQTFECYLIDFGHAICNDKKSNFSLFLNFVERLEYDLKTRIFVKKANCWQDMFKQTIYKYVV